MWQMINSFNDENKGICFKLNLAAKKITKICCKNSQCLF
nr:MAG TPA: hypothetical protein [Caudoviricetes sp.]